jgi:two-component system chemotaxis response regulator CheB
MIEGDDAATRGAHMPGEGNGPGHDVVVIGASAGGIEALTALAGNLPADLQAAVFVVIHLPTGGTSVLPAILNRAGPLPAEHVRDSPKIELGRIYVAPPDFHLHLDDGTVSAVTGPRENGHRPAIDRLFRSAAHAFRQRAVGVILSGTLDDGTLGLLAIKEHGGVALVQDPATAQHDSMPRSAIKYAHPDEVASPSELARLIVELADDPLETAEVEGARAELSERAPDVARQSDRHPQPGNDTGLTCPECGGAIWRQDTGAVTSFRCRVGHAYTTESFLVAQGQVVEAALWTSLRLIEERVQLMRQLAERFRAQPRTSSSFLAKAGELEREAAALRPIVEGVAQAVTVAIGDDG